MFAWSKKGGGRQGYRERVREREGKREQDGEWEKSSQFGEGSSNGPSNRGRVGLTLKLLTCWLRYQKIHLKKEKFLKGTPPHFQN